MKSGGLGGSTKAAEAERDIERQSLWFTVSAFFCFPQPRRIGNAFTLDENRLVCKGLAMRKKMNKKMGRN